MSAPITTADPSVRLCDTSTMVVIHRMFRRQIGMLSTLVGGVEDGDTDRAHLIAEHGFQFLDALHHHHLGEDELVWPKLSERAAVDGPLIARMEAQHAEIGVQIDRASRNLATWASTAESPRGRELTARVRSLSNGLAEHLTDEERFVLPVVERHIDEDEWTELAARGMSSIQRQRLPVFLAYVLEDTAPAEREAFLARVPEPARLAFEQFGRAQMEVESKRLRGSR